MPLKAIRFVALMLAALTMALSFCHLMQFPSRMAWDQDLWVGSTAQGGLYAMFGPVGALIDVAGVIALGSWLISSANTGGRALCWRSGRRCYSRSLWRCGGDSSIR